MEASVTLKNVGKLAGDRTILAGLTFGIEKGSLVAIIGENDAGKSTFLKVIAGLENAEHGNVFIRGLDSIKRRNEVRKLIGYVSLDNDFDPWLTLEQNIRFIGLLYQMDDQVISRRMHYLASKLGMQESMGKMVKELSTGTLKKGLYIRALLHDPEIIIIDEPTAFMDAESARQTWDLLQQYHGDKTVIYVSQSLSEVEMAHDRIMVMRQGKIILDGNLDILLESTGDYHHFQLEFEDLTDELFNKLSSITTVVTPSRTGNIFHFYGRSKKTFFQVIEMTSGISKTDFNFKKLGLEDLMDSQLAGGGLE